MAGRSATELREEIEVTPAMIFAGVRAFYDRKRWGEELPEDAVVRIYTAMEREAPCFSTTKRRVRGSAKRSGA